MLKTLLQSALKLAGSMAMPLYYNDASTVVNFNNGEPVKTVAPFDSYVSCRIYVNAQNVEASFYCVGKYLFSNVSLSSGSNITTTFPVRKGDEIEVQLTSNNWTSAQLTFWEIRGVSDFVP